jgi:hypothetical protein
MRRWRYRSFFGALLSVSGILIFKAITGARLPALRKSLR